MAFSLPLPLSVHTGLNLHSHNMPKLPNAMAQSGVAKVNDVELMSKKLTQLAQVSIIEPLATKIQSNINKYSAQQFKVPSVTFLSDPFPARVPSINESSFSSVEIGAKLKGANSSELTPHQIKIRQCWIAVAITASLTALGVILSLACPPLVIVGLAIAVLAGSSLLTSVGFLIDRYRHLDLDDEATRQEVRHDLHSTKFQSLAGDWDYQTLADYDLLQARFSSLKEEDKLKAYGALAGLFKQHKAANYSLEKALSSIDQECQQGLADEAELADQAREQVSELCKETMSSIETMACAVAIGHTVGVSQQVAMPLSGFVSVESQEMVHLLTREVKRNLMLIECDGKERVGLEFNKKVEPYRGAIRVKKANVRAMREAFAGKIDTAYESIGASSKRF